MGTLRDSATVVIDVDRTVIDALVAVLPVVADVQCQAVRDQSLVRKLEYQTVGHLLDDDSSLVIRIRAGENLTFGQAVGFRAIGIDLLHPAGFQPPGVVDENLSVYAELLVKYLRKVNAGSCQFTHRMDAMFFQPADGAGPSLPEIGERLVIPEQIPEGFFVKLCDADTVLVRCGVLGGDVHCQLCQV